MTPYGVEYGRFALAAASIRYWVNWIGQSKMLSGNAFMAAYPLLRR
ncbi:MAG: hypothetical protein ACR2IG_02570 [Roseomonas sp.]